MKEGKIVAFKLSNKYKKAVYKTREEVEKGDKAAVVKQSKAAERPLEEYSLEKDCFLVCKDEQKARELSSKLRERIEKGEIKGIKGFDGFFYIIENRLYQKHRGKALAAIRTEKGIALEKLSELLGINKVLAKIVCQFLNEEGEIIEKRKERFQAV